MRAYNYLLYRIYTFYTDKIREKDIPLFYTSCVSTVLVYFNFMTVYSLLIYAGLFKDIIPGKYYALIPMGIIWILNYFTFVKGERFLGYNFKKDIKGGILIILYILLTAVSSITVTNYSREKIFRQQNEHPVSEQVKQKPSLEGKIRKWWKNNF